MSIVQVLGIHLYAIALELTGFTTGLADLGGDGFIANRFVKVDLLGYAKARVTGSKPAFPQVQPLRRRQQGVFKDKVLGKNLLQEVFHFPVGKTMIGKHLVVGGSKNKHAPWFHDVAQLYQRFPFTTIFLDMLEHFAAGDEIEFFPLIDRKIRDSTGAKSAKSEKFL